MIARGVEVEYFKAGRKSRQRGPAALAFPADRESRQATHSQAAAGGRGHRVHPKNYPVVLPDRLLRRASENDLAEHFGKHGGTSDQDERVRALRASGRIDVLTLPECPDLEAQS